jgi:hypothetical protein
MYIEVQNRKIQLFFPELQPDDQKSVYKQQKTKTDHSETKQLTETHKSQSHEIIQNN